MIGFILTISLVNVGVGFAAAVYLGWRHRRLLAVELHSSETSFPASDMFPPMVSAAATVPETAAESEALSQAAVDSAVDSAVASTADSEEVGPSALEASPEDVDSPLSAREQGPAEIAMTDLRGRVRTYQEQVIDIDGLLRQLSQSPDVPKVEECVKTFQDVNEQYLKARGEAYESLQQPEAAETLGAPVLEELRSAVETQTQRIESAQAVMKSIDYQGDLAKACQQVTGQAVQLTNANHALRDTLDQAWATASAAQKWPTPVDEANADGMLVGLANRTGLEAALAKWRETEAQSTKSLCLAAIDLDRFARVNERYGPKTGDRLLHALAQMFVREGNRNNVVGRSSGQRFVVLFPETDLRLTTSVVERIRQMVELSHFQCGDEEIQVTVSCAVVEAKPHDDLAALLVRADAAIQEAKRYGRNRTFLYEGEYPTPVVPPNFALEDRSIAL